MIELNFFEISLLWLGWFYSVLAYWHFSPIKFNLFLFLCKNILLAILFIWKRIFTSKNKTNFASLYGLVYFPVQLIINFHFYFARKISVHKIQAIGRHKLHNIPAMISHHFFILFFFFSNSRAGAMNVLCYLCT